MKAQYPQTDTVNLVITALSCDSTEAQAISKSSKHLIAKGPAWFETACVSLNATEDQRPVIHVNSPAFYFNITKYAVFQDLVFDGINAFAQI
jgi:hypothetical protein